MVGDGIKKTLRRLRRRAPKHTAKLPQTEANR